MKIAGLGHVTKEQVKSISKEDCALCKHLRFAMIWMQNNDTKCLCLVMIVQLCTSWLLKYDYAKYFLLYFSGMSKHGVETFKTDLLICPLGAKEFCCHFPWDICKLGLWQ